jgi:glycosyltransferase involved in cell wall biosynthesis
MKVSVITPTHQNREEHLRRLYHVFKAQTYPHVELLVLDDSPQPSPFYSTLRDDTVVYMYSSTPLTLGQKRNQLVEMARGEVIVHMDDDDYYAPSYVTQMLTQLGDRDFVTLSGWYSYVWGDQKFYYWDTETVAPYHFQLCPNGHHRAIEMASLPADEQYEWMTNMLWGFGFSYVYRRSLWQQVRFEDTINACEDFYFVMAAMNQGYGDLAYVADRQGLVLHLIHQANTSRILPQYTLPLFLLPQLFGQGVMEYLSINSGGNNLGS